MRSVFSPHTYQISALHKSALARGIFVFLSLSLTIVLVIEITARMILIPFSFPSLGSNNFYFDYKVYALENLVRREGRLDCLILGSSVANADLDPAYIQATYRAQTGKTIYCANIGIPALTAENATPIARAIIQRYAPSVILFILIPRDLMDHEYSVDQLETNPWVRYHQGKISPQNWFIVNAYSLRYFTTWQYWQTPKNRAKMEKETGLITSTGFSQTSGQNNPYPRDWLLENDANLQGTWQLERTQRALNNLTALQTPTTRFIFIEAPSYSNARLERDDPAIQHYETDYIANLQTYLSARDIPFWRTIEVSQNIPEQGWFDWLHLNAEGAAILSRWVAEKMAEIPDLFK